MNASEAMIAKHKVAPWRGLPERVLNDGHRPSLLRFHSSRLRLYGMERRPSSALENIEEDGSVASELEASLAL